MTHSFHEIKAAIFWWDSLSQKEKDSIEYEADIKLIRDIVDYWIVNVKPWENFRNDH